MKRVRNHLKMKLIIRILITTGLLLFYISMFNKSYQNTKKLKQKLVAKEKELMASFSRYMNVRQQNDNLKDIDAVCSSQFKIKKLEQIIKMQLFDSTMDVDSQNCRITFLNVSNNSNMNFLPFEAEIKAQFSDVAEFLVRLEQQYSLLMISRLNIEPDGNFETVTAVVSGMVFLPR